MSVTVRDLIESARHLIENGHLGAARIELASAVKALDESETAWRNDGSTYRLVSDVVEVAS